MYSPHTFSPFSLPVVSQFCAFKDNRGRCGHLPGGHRHWKRLTLSTHCPLFTQGLLWHSFISSSQWTPLKPEQNRPHKWLREREKGIFQTRKSKLAKMTTSSMSMNISVEDKGAVPWQWLFHHTGEPPWDIPVTVKWGKRLPPKILVWYSMPTKTVPHSLTCPGFAFRTVPGP